MINAAYGLFHKWHFDFHICFCSITLDLYSISEGEHDGAVL